MYAGWRMELVGRSYWRSGCAYLAWVGAGHGTCFQLAQDHEEASYFVNASQVLRELSPEFLPLGLVLGLLDFAQTELAFQSQKILGGVRDLVS